MLGPSIHAQMSANNMIPPGDTSMKNTYILFLGELEGTLYICLLA